MAARKNADNSLSPLGFSRFAGRLLAARPQLQEELDQAAHGPWTRASMQVLLKSHEAGDESALRTGLRRLRQRVMLRVLARDLGGLAGLGGVMLALGQGAFDPNLGVAPLFLIFTTVVLGGIGSAFGALAAGLALGLAMEMSTWSGLFGGVDSRYKPVLAFLVLILLLLYRPQGLFGRARVL